MSLKEYAKKRSFDKTPEPAPPAGSETSTTLTKPGDAGRFFVQRHDATRLHYDFRLEIDGTLKSWAVPKGPTLDPTPKRLAAHVEDHPLDYGNFEGNIPAGNYGAGSVMLWDRGGFQLLGQAPAAEQIAKGDLKFRLNGEKLKGEFALVHMRGRGKGNEWLLIKKRDAAATPGWDVEAHAYSVLSGRTQEEIAKGLPARNEKKKTAGDPGRTWESSRPARTKSRVPVQTVRSEKAQPEKAREPPAETIDLSTLDGARKAPMPAAIAPMKSTLASRLPLGDEWLYEIKWDGVRALCFIENGNLRIFSRTGNPCEKQYPELSVAPHYVAGQQAILDGEIAALDERGVSRFALIQPRIANSDPNAVAHMARSRPVTLFLFDVMYLDGYDLRQVALRDRKRVLESIVTPNSVLRLSQHFAGAGEHLLEAAQENGLEGIIAKHANSCYEPRRSREWLKFKIVSQQEFVICGYTEGERDYFSSLVLGMYEGGKLVYVGNVGTGFDQKLLKLIFDKIQPLTTTRSPFAEKVTLRIPRNVIWVRPELVCEIKFSNWTEDNRLRAPVFLGLRPDVDARECVRERPLEAEPEQVETSSPTLPAETLLPANKEEAILTVDGRHLKFTNLSKVFYPREGYTKRDLIEYYNAVAPLLVPHLKDRPLSLKRYPNGIEGEYFFQKNTPETFSGWLRFELIDSEHVGRAIRYVLCEDRASLVYLANLGCIDQNPWMSRVGSLENPDYILIDLDPQGCEYEKIIEAAQLVRRKLDFLELEGYPKTTGGDGMHICVPVEPVYSYAETRSVAEVIARVLAAERPDLFTTPRPVAKREQNKVYFDYLQNGESKTIAAPYVLRAYPGAPVATPLTWREVMPGLLPSHFHIRNAVERFARVGDLFAGVLTKPQRLEDSLEKLEELVNGR